MPNLVTCRRVLRNTMNRPPKIWIDLDNTPHVPLFRPIVRELQQRGYTVVLTARDAFQVCELADRYGLQYEKVGRHYGKRLPAKVFGLLVRSLQLAPFAWREQPALALSHGARSQILLANALGIPTVLMYDYEHAQSPPFCRPRWRIAPDAIVAAGLADSYPRVRSYPGLKEDVYAPDFFPDPAILVELGLSPEDLIVTVRPPADEAHYRNPESDALFIALMDRMCDSSQARVVLLPRNQRQENEIRDRWPRWFTARRTLVPGKAVNGLNLLWFSDLAVSGGGTMNREAAALGVPVYSIFRGKTGAVDRQLEAEGRLVMIRTAEDVQTRIALCRRDKSRPPDGSPREALRRIIAHLEEILRLETSRRSAEC